MGESMLNMSNKAFKTTVMQQQATKDKAAFYKIIQRSMMAVLLVTTTVSAAGCAGGVRIPRLGVTDALLTKYRDNVWARRAFTLRYANCNIPYAEHFQNGFIAGYCQKSNGGDGYVPALPPEEYRGFEFQSADGAQCVKAWFDGFPAGIAAAQKDRAGDYHDIYTSKLINSAITQEKAKHLLPDDVPVVSGNAKRVKLDTAASASAAAKYREARLPTALPDPVDALSIPSYVAPPAKSSNPILKPNEITPDDLVPAPKIRKTGPSAMKRASSKFVIDPAVVVAAPPAPIRPSTETEVEPIVRQPKASEIVENTLPPIVTGVNKSKSSRNARVAEKLKPIVVDQTPLPIAIRKPSWRSDSSSIRR